MRVLLLHQGGGDGGLYGSDVVFRQTVEALRGESEPLVVLDGPGPLAEHLEEMGIEVAIRDLGVLRRRFMTPHGFLLRLAKIAAASWWLRRVIRRERIDVVYSSTIAVIAGGVAARWARCPHIWHVHEILIHPKAVARYLYRLVARLSTRIVANSKATARHLAQLTPLGAAKTVVVPNSVETAPFDAADGQRFRDELGIDASTVLIGYIGRLHHLKGLGYLLEALRRLRDAGLSGFQVVLVGEVYPGYEALRTQLERHRNAFGLDQIVHFVGHREDVVEIHKALDLLVAPSSQPESFGLSVLEAMAAGKPVVATNHGGPVELIEEGASGYLVPTDDPELFGERLTRLVEDADLRARMGLRARGIAGQRYTRERFVHGIRSAVLEPGDRSPAN